MMGRSISSGNVVIAHKFANDFLTEGDETFSIKLYTDSNRTNEVASSSFVVKDTVVGFNFFLP